MGNTYMPKPENRYPNNVSGFEHIWELDMLSPNHYHTNIIINSGENKGIKMPNIKNSQCF